MIPKLIEKWQGRRNPGVEFRALGFKTKSAAKRFLRAKKAKKAKSAAKEYSSGEWYRYADGRDARLSKSDVAHEYPWQVHFVQNKH